MDKRKLIIGVVVLLLLVVVACAVVIFARSKGDGTVEDGQGVKTEAFYSKISDANEFTFTKVLDDSNKVVIMVKGDRAYKEVMLNGVVQKYILKDGDTYFLDESTKKFFVYKNNDMILNEIQGEIEALKENATKTGREKVDGRSYDYEEFEQYQRFLINNKIAVSDTNNAKTRLYYDNKNLVYIKTILGDTEELLKVNLSYESVDDNYFEIPSDYTNGEKDIE